MSDTYTFSVHNPAEANMDITAVRVWDLNETGTITNCPEGETTNYDYELVKFSATIENLGEESAEATVVLKDDAGNTLETETITLDGGASGGVMFDNNGSGYSLPDGETKTYTVEVTP